MAATIEIIELEINNYRQFGGEQKIKFQGRKKGFSTIVGENGAGKSNILNAINWCFYKKEPHQGKNEGLYIINKKYLTSLKTGEEGTMSVKVKIRKGDDEFHISRILVIKKGKLQYEDRNDGEVLKINDDTGYLLPEGCEPVESKSTFEILRKKSDQTEFHQIKNVLPNAQMNEILPATLSSYFLLDGEYLEKFWEELSRVKIGIEEISQLHILSTANEHVTEMQKNVPEIGNKTIDNHTADINIDQYYIDSKDSKGNDSFSVEMRWNYDSEIHENECYHSFGKPRIEEMQADLTRMENALLDIGKKFQGSNIQAVNQLHDDQEKGEAEHKKLSIELEDIKKQYIGSQIKNGPVFFLHPAITNTIRIVDDLRVKGQLPYQAKKIFTNDLLERDRCICDTDLVSDLDGKGNEKNIHRKKVEAVRDDMGENQGLDIGVDMKYHFEETTMGTLQEPKFAKFMEESFDVPRDAHKILRDKVKKCAEANHELRLKLQAVGETDVTELVKEQEYLLTRSGEIRDFIKEEEYTIKTKIKNISYNKIERNKLLTKNERTRKIAHEQKIWQILSDIFDTAFSDLKKEIREDVQEKTFETFKDIQYKEGEYLRFIIKDDYTAQLVDKDKHPALGTLSAGEKLFLALSFISALKDATDYTFPLIIDTPLGRVSGAPRYLLSQALPKYLPDEQIIFLATNTEFLDPITNWSDDPEMLEKEGHPEESFGQMLERNIGMKYWQIQRDANKTNTRILDLVPKWRR